MKLPSVWLTWHQIASLYENHSSHEPSLLQHYEGWQNESQNDVFSIRPTATEGVDWTEPVKPDSKSPLARHTDENDHLGGKRTTKDDRSPLLSQRTSTQPGFLSADNSGPVGTEASPSWQQSLLLRTTILVMLFGAVSCVRYGKGSSCIYLAPAIALGVMEVLLCRHIALMENGLSFSAPLGAAVVEAMKLGGTLIILAIRGGWHHFRTVGISDALLLLIAAMFYFAINVGYYVVVSLVTVADYAISYQVRVVLVAILWTLILKTSLTHARWIACLGICIANAAHHGSFGNVHFYTLPLVLGQSALAACSNIICEKVYKAGQQLEINVQNACLYSYGCLFGLIFFAGSWLRHPEIHVTAGLGNPKVILLLVIHAFQGLFVSRILKYVDSVSQAVAGAMVGPISIGFAARYLNEPLGTGTMIGVAVAYASSALFWINPAFGYNCLRLPSGK